MKALVVGVEPIWGLKKDNTPYHFASVYLAKSKEETVTEKFSNFQFGTCIETVSIFFQNRPELDAFISSVNGHDFPATCELVEETFLQRGRPGIRFVGIKVLPKDKVAA